MRGKTCTSSQYGPIERLKEKRLRKTFKICIEQIVVVGVISKGIYVQQGDNRLPAKSSGIDDE
jgi:hypothetical protein